jgi:hypothetical protein
MRREMSSNFKAAMELPAGLDEGWRRRDAKEPHGSKEPSFLRRSGGRFSREARFKRGFLGLQQFFGNPGSK